MTSYIDAFPFSDYIILRDTAQLPLVLVMRKVAASVCARAVDDDARAVGRAETMVRAGQATGDVKEASND